MSGYRPLRELADALARAGIASLRLDDRGVGASSGAYEGFALDALVRDAHLAVRWLGRHPGIDAGRIALVGHSEGALVAMRLAREQGGAVRALVLLGASASPGSAVVAWQQRYGAERLVRDTVVSRRGPLADSLRREAERLVDAIADVSRPFRTFLRHRPLDDARRLRLPALVVHGAADRQVPPGDDSTLAAALRTRGAPVARLRVPGVNHLFLSDSVGDPAQYLSLPDRRLAPGVADAVTAWLRQILH